MGKKVIQQLASTRRASKNVDEQLHGVNKVLRPKVYITHSSSFKQLVQELTGYRDQTVPVPNDVANVVPVIGIEDQGEMFPNLASTLFTDSSLDCSFESLGDQTFQLSDMNEIAELLQTGDREMFGDMSNSSTTSDGQADWLACQNLESWLLDADQYYGGPHEQEISPLDYELLSGLI
ncbi:hypothetical protein GQ457_05G005140 [Hibiscus cannabinus]